MKKLDLTGIKEMLKKEQRMKITSGYTPGDNLYECSCIGGDGGMGEYYGANCSDGIEQTYMYQGYCDAVSCYTIEGTWESCNG